MSAADRRRNAALAAALAGLGAIGLGALALWATRGPDILLDLWLACF